MIVGWLLCGGELDAVRWRMVGKGGVWKEVVFKEMAGGGVG